MCSLEGKKYFRKKHISFFFTLIPKFLPSSFLNFPYEKTWKKGTFKAEKSIFPCFLTPLIAGIKVKVLEAEKVENSKSWKLLP